MDRVANFLSQKTPRRLLALIAFGTVLYLFRHLALLLVFFVTFERALGWSARTLSARTGLHRKKCVLIVLGVIAIGLGILAWLGIGKTVRTFASMQDDFPERLSQLREHPLVRRAEEQIGGMEKVVESAKHYSGSALSAASAIGHFVIHIVMGFVLALVYVLEEDEIDAFWARVDRRSITGTLARWFGHVADATIVTVQLQLIVAACNTLLTLPVLLVIGVPNVGALMILIFVSALVPVIGNIVSGVTLSLLAYQQKGWLGVGLFVGLTFILHKIESYYLNPRLTSRHVKMPGFLLIVSLIACEHLFGFTGLFLSFPILFVAGRIRTDFLEEDVGIAASPIALTDDPGQLTSAREAAPLSASGVELETERVPLDSIRPDAPAPVHAIPTPPATPVALKSPPSRPPREL
ncbi:MAG TPA: AI-2E family transporter [Labilithrix sp.]|nr:AI-2E family transporter [Labilithrix sp.]